MYHLRTWLILAVVLIAVILAPCALAQETTAGIQGTVKDPSGALIANATVEVSGSALLGTRKIKTDDAGYYRFALLPPGEYSVMVSAPGFRSYKQPGVIL